MTPMHPKIRRETSRRIFRREGLAVVEMAILLPLLLIIVLGMMEYGWCFLKQEQVLNTARQAARLGATVDATTAQVQNQIVTMMNSYGMPGNVYTYTLTDTSGNPVTVETVPQGDPLEVTITVDYSQIAINSSSVSAAPIQLPMPSTITGMVAMMKEGQ